VLSYNHRLAQLRRTRQRFWAIIGYIHLYTDLNNPILTAMAMAISDSVTVSMGELTRGALSVNDLVSGELRSTSSAVKSM